MDVERLFLDNKVLIRAMDMPSFVKFGSDLAFDCSVWINEFDLMKKNIFSSVSTTLLVSGVAVSTYKNIGYLVDSTQVDCFHISKSDSGSHGNLLNGDFFAFEKDFEIISDLAKYIKGSNDTTMNEVNVNMNLNAVIGLVLNKCINEYPLLRSLLILKNALYEYTQIDYPIYEYDRENGKLSLVDIEKKIETSIYKDIFKNYTIDNYIYFTDYSDGIFYRNITGTSKKV